MNKKEKLFWSLAYLATLLLTLLPFFQVGLANTDDFEYYNTSHYPTTWIHDSIIYAHAAGRFYFFLTKFFYYIPYLGDNFVLTKFIQYFTVVFTYALFSYLIYKIFKSKRLGALTGLLLIFNMTMGVDKFYPPTSFPFYFHFSLIFFLFALLLYVDYAEKGGYWRVIVSAILVLISCLFYENYVLFTVIFIAIVFVLEWCRNGFVAMWKSKQFYLKLCPFIVITLVYMACYVGYRFYLMKHFEDAVQYDGSVVTNSFNWSQFFKILVSFTTYTIPGKIYGLRHIQEAIVDNSPLISGHQNNVWFVLTHASAVAYINAIIQCAMLWYLVKKADFQKTSWTKIIVGFFITLFVAFASHTLVAVAEKYNSGVYDMSVYVTSMYSYFTIVLAIALLVVASVKIIKNEKARNIVVSVWCLLLVCFSLHISYTNDHLSKEWERSQNRIVVMDLVAETNQFENIPENSILYIESLLHTSKLGWSVCCNNHVFPSFISRTAKKPYIFAASWEDLQNAITQHPESEVYFLQVSESKKFGEMLFAFSHINQFGDQLSSFGADSADVYYYSPTKKYVLFYGVKNADEGVSYKAYKYNPYDIHMKLTHVHIQDDCLCPMEFRISNME